MTTYNYFPNLPNAPDYPGDDQPGMQTNSASTNAIIGVDHIGFNAMNGGWHNLVHMVSQGTSDPGASSVGLLYTKTVSDPMVPVEDQLFYESPIGNVNRLTGGYTLQNGYQYVGKIIIQWGFVADSGTNQVVTFSNPNNIQFPNNIFNVQVTAVRGATKYTVNYAVAPGYTTSGFTIVNADVNNTSYAYFWTAIGN